MKTYNTTQYAYDGMYAVCEFGGHLDLEYQYIYANGLLLARYDKSSPDTHYYHHDGLGSIVGLTAENTFVEQSYFYDEFGNELASWGSVSNHYLYTGQEYDGSISQLYNLRARLYDMRIGRFVVEDPIKQSLKEPQSLNEYTYVSNNPLDFSDILGLGKSQCTWGKILLELMKIERFFVKCSWMTGYHYNCFVYATDVCKCIKLNLSQNPPEPECCTEIQVDDIVWNLPLPIIPPFAALPHYGIKVTCHHSSQGSISAWYDPETIFRGIPSFYP